MIIVVFHHTSNWDFPTGLLLRKKLGFNSNFVGKAILFKPPFGFIFRSLGGYPVERDSSKKRISLTKSIINLYNKEEALTIAFTPEGTRSKVTKLKSGFWVIAKKANVPILFIDFDFSTKTFHFDKPHTASETFEDEYQLMKAFFQNSKGFNPELSFNFDDNDMGM